MTMEQTSRPMDTTDPQSYGHKLVHRRQFGGIRDQNAKTPN